MRKFAPKKTIELNEKGRQRPPMRTSAHHPFECNQEGQAIQLLGRRRRIAGTPSK